MSYLGEKPTQTLAAPTSQYFNGDGSTVAFTLNRPVNVSEDLEVFVNNIQQEPGVGKSYTATGTTLTFDAAPSSGTGNVYVVYRGLAEVTTRLEHDANAALAATTGTFSGDLTVDTNTLYVDSTNNRVGIGTSSPLAPLNASYIDASRNDLLLLTNRNTGGYGPWINFYGDYNGGYSFAKIGAENDSTGGSMRFHTANTSGTSTERMRIDNSGRVTTPYQPAFSAYSGTAQGSSSGIYTVQFTTAHLNTGSHYNNSNYRFTCPVAGVYYFSYKVMAYTNSYLRMGIYKNGSLIGEQSFSENQAYSNNTFDVITSCSANDYVEVKGDVNSAGEGYIHDNYRFFVGYLIG